MVNYAKMEKILQKYEKINKNSQKLYKVVEILLRYLKIDQYLQNNVTE